MEENRNIALRLDETAASMPDGLAVVESKRRSTGYDYTTWTFAQLKSDSDRLANGMASMGIGRGRRIALMVRPSLNFISLTFALFKTGASIVLIDPGMGRKNLLRCLDQVQPDGIVAIPLVHIVRSVSRRRFQNAKLNIVVGQRWSGRAPTLHQVRQLADSTERTASARDSEEAAIIFTTGSTGPPKGVLYTHGTFNAQVDQIQSRYAIRPGGTDLAGFPLFGLFNTAMGMTTVVPDMDPTRPASVDPKNIVQHIEDRKVSQSFASPAVWNAVGKHCQTHQVRLPTLRRVFSAGAPVPPHVLRWMSECMVEDGEIYTPYGATEALPVASISASEVLSETAARSAVGAGTCVGTRFDGIQWRVIGIQDDAIASMEEAVELPTGQIGELIVRGAQVTTQYTTSASATRAAKIADGESLWHRMGDLGYFDEKDRFWFCGRKAHRVEAAHGTLFSVPTEAIFNEHASIYRSALIGLGVLGQQIPVMICEPWPDCWPRRRADKQQLIDELAGLAAANEVSEAIAPRHILLKRALPVDIRHNAKIFREQLVDWAAARSRRGWP